MKPFTLSILTLLFATVSTGAQDNLNPDQKILRQLEYEWLMAEFRVDTATISKMMDSSFMAIGENKISSKKEELVGIYKNMFARKMNKHIVDSLYFDDLHINIFNNTAVVSFISVTKGSINAVPFNNRRTRMYDVWIKRQGHWKAVSSQVTPIE
jgi:hypothetical protein